MNSLELTSVITALANAIACKLTLSEISLLASIFVQLGDGVDPAAVNISEWIMAQQIANGEYAQLLFQKFGTRLADTCNIFHIIIQITCHDTKIKRKIKLDQKNRAKKRCDSVLRAKKRLLRHCFDRKMFNFV